ncbi:hypothetical protein [Streptomyces californicus]
MRLGPWATQLLQTQWLFAARSTSYDGRQQRRTQTEVSGGVGDARSRPPW